MKRLNLGEDFIDVDNDGNIQAFISGLNYWVFTEPSFSVCLLAIDRPSIDNLGYQNQFEMINIDITIDQFVDIKNDQILPSFKGRLLQAFQRYQKLQAFQ